MNLPDNLPPLPPVPPGFDRWEYRGEAWKSKHHCLFGACEHGDERWWGGFERGRPMETLGSSRTHYIEAVRDKPAETLLDQGLQDNRPPA